MGKSKNNPANRSKDTKGKTFNGKPVKPVLYIGTHVGHGKYVAVQYEDGKMATDEGGKPIMWDAI
jgi:hypothetical protein